MQARKWISNSPKVMAAIPVDERATELTINDDQDPITNTLGLAWNSIEDVFTVPTVSIPPEMKITKRNVKDTIGTK